MRKRCVRKKHIKLEYAATDLNGLNTSLNHISLTYQFSRLRFKILTYNTDFSVLILSIIMANFFNHLLITTMTLKPTLETKPHRLREVRNTYPVMPRMPI